MARETQKEKIARLETELAQAINQRDAAIADALVQTANLTQSMMLATLRCIRTCFRIVTSGKGLPRTGRIRSERMSCDMMSC